MVFCALVGFGCFIVDGLLSSLCFCGCLSGIFCGVGIGNGALGCVLSLLVGCYFIVISFWVLM